MQRKGGWAEQMHGYSEVGAGASPGQAMSFFFGGMEEAAPPRSPQQRAAPQRGSPQARPPARGTEPREDLSPAAIFGFEEPHGKPGKRTPKKGK